MFADNFTNTDVKNNILTYPLDHKQQTENRLIDSIYDAAIDPQKYDELLLLWEDEFFVTPTRETSQQVDGAIENHIRRAHKILSLTNPQQNEPPRIEQLVDADPLPTLILSRDQIVTLANQVAQNLFGVKIGKKLPHNAFSADDILKIKHYLTHLNKHKSDRVLAIIQPQNEEGQATYLFALSKIDDVNSRRSLLQISVVNTVWNETVGKTIQTTFALTDAEIDLAKRYVAGEKLADIAFAKGRSINTVKTQSKSLFRKTKLKSQSELIRLFSALQQFAQQENNGRNNALHLEEPVGLNSSYQHFIGRAYINRMNGRKLYYETYGDPDGEPVLYLHGVISGTKFTHEIMDLFRAQKIKLIAPHRAGFGKSDPHFEQREEGFVEDVRAVLVAEQVDKFKVVGQFAGAYYAFILGAALPERILKMRLINSHAPIESKNQLSKIMGRPLRTLVYTARYIPQLLPFLLSNMDVQVRKNGGRYSMNKYYRESAFDYELCQDAEIGEVVIDGFLSCYAQGNKFVTQQVKNLYQKDWSHLIADCPVPIELYHSTKDISVPLWVMQDLAKKHHQLKLTIVEGGQLILYKYPKTILADL
uniref:HTH luxR-type domain-containing protein n=1 Tax=OCS116 cluster bacterium TaxID=2030921 RepID=A0A2A4Z3S4_9PROT